MFNLNPKERVTIYDASLVQGVECGTEPFRVEEVCANLLERRARFTGFIPNILSQWTGRRLIHGKNYLVCRCSVRFV